MMIQRTKKAQSTVEKATEHSFFVFVF